MVQLQPYDIQIDLDRQENLLRQHLNPNQISKLNEDVDLDRNMTDDDGIIYRLTTGFLIFQCLLL